MTHHSITSNPTLRRATVDDAAALAQITISTFTQTFGHLYPPEDLQAFLDQCTLDHCRGKLADQSGAIWFAVVNDNSGKEVVAGFVSAGPCRLPVDQLEATAGEVKQLYLDAAYQNLKIGTRLMDAALTWLAAQQLSPLYLGVWSENFGAQRFYARYGFNKVGEYGFPVGNTVDLEFILKR
jgi:diamine N-acetyltransferase